MATIQGNMRDDGMCRVYDIFTKKWKHTAPVNAREQITRGTASLTGPTESMTKDGEQPRLACPEEVAALRADGWEVASGADPSAAESGDGGGASGRASLAGSERSASLYDFGQHNVPELKLLAKAAGVTDGVTMRRSELVTALVNKRYIPTADDLNAIEDERRS